MIVLLLSNYFLSIINQYVVRFLAETPWTIAQKTAIFDVIKVITSLQLIEGARVMEEKKNVGESNTLISAGASSPKMASRQDDALAAGDVLDPQEQAFLRHYSDSLSRFHAMIAAGYYQNDNTIESKDLMVAQQEVIAQAGAILGRAERLPLPTIASAVGADKVAFLARLWAICCCDKAHEAIKGLQLLGRIHGVWGKDGGSDRRTALVFVSPSPRAHGTVPTDLPFTLSRDAYRMFAEPPEASDEASDSENGRANEPE